MGASGQRDALDAEEAVDDFDVVRFKNGEAVAMA